MRSSPKRVYKAGSIPVTPVMKLKDYQIGEKFDALELQLIVGKKVKYIHGYTDNEWGDPVFHITRMVFEDDTEASINGEHDIAYVEGFYPQGDKDFTKKLRDLHCLDKDNDCNEE